MERLLEVQDHEVVDVVVEVGAAELAGLPVERGLEGVLDRERAAGDPEVVRVALGRHVGREGVDERGHLRV